MAGRARYRGEIPDGQAFCTKCEQCWPLTNFTPDKRKANGAASWCRQCVARRAAAGRSDKLGGWWDYYLRSTFGITESRFLDLLAAQGGGCGICGTAMPWSETARLQNFSVDHDHACCPGKKSCGRCVRGLLCNRCNRALGQFGDDAGTLRRAIAYLTTSRGEVNTEVEAAT
jgi:hypothetical protein